MGEEVLEAQAVEEPVSGDAEAAPARPLPAKASRAGEVDVWRGEVRTAAIAAAGGIVAGAATVVAVRAVGAAGVSSRRAVRRKAKAPNVIASRSFLVDVHVLGR